MNTINRHQTKRQRLHRYNKQTLNYKVGITQIQLIDMKITCRDYIDTIYMKITGRDYTDSINSHENNRKKDYTDTKNKHENNRQRLHRYNKQT